MVSRSGRACPGFFFSQGARKRPVSAQPKMAVNETDFKRNRNTYFEVIVALCVCLVRKTIASHRSQKTCGRVRAFVRAPARKPNVARGVRGTLGSVPLIKLSYWLHLFG